MRCRVGRPKSSRSPVGAPEDRSRRHGPPLPGQTVRAAVRGRGDAGAPRVAPDQEGRRVHRGGDGHDGEARRQRRRRVGQREADPHLQHGEARRQRERPEGPVGQPTPRPGRGRQQSQQQQRADGLGGLAPRTRRPGPGSRSRAAAPARRARRPPPRRAWRTAAAGRWPAAPRSTPRPIQQRRSAPAAGQPEDRAEQHVDAGRAVRRRCGVVV